MTIRGIGAESAQPVWVEQLSLVTWCGTEG